jgi:hypothetical protein
MTQYDNDACTSGSIFIEHFIGNEKCTTFALSVYLPAARDTAVSELELVVLLPSCS